MKKKQTDDVFIGQDSEGHWYVIPKSLEEEWFRQTTDDPTTDEEVALFIKTFGKYITGAVL